jgi:prophage maintenance system killer protein
VAFFSTDVFLRLNGWKMEVNDEEAHAFLTRHPDAGTCDFAHLLPWIRQHLAHHESG